jgi:hypothetical protein
MNIMKRKNSKRKLFSYFVIWSVLLSSLLLYSPDNIALSATGVPEIKIFTPDEGSVVDVSKVEFTGRISDDSTSPDKLSIKVVEQLSNSDKPIDITSEGKLAITNKGDYGEFTFSKDFNEGMHTLSFAVLNEAGSSNEITKTFTIIKATAEQTKNSPVATGNVKAKTMLSSAMETGTRPYIVEMNLIPPNANDKSNYLPAEDMTQVPLNDQIQIVVRSAEALTSQPLIMVSSNKGKIIEGKIEESTQLANNIVDYVYTFTPSLQLDPSTTYYVYLKTDITNDPGKNILPRFFKFTTININHLDDIHGNYQNNTNACAYCHSAHNGKNAQLEGGQYGAAADNYCMVCHDGTNGSPMTDKYNTVNNHAVHIGSNLTTSDSCTSCHNPHVPWTKENPNRLKGINVTDASGSHYQPYTYKKASTAEGKAEDFTLCLSCHNGTSASNIEQYYKPGTKFSESGHNIQATTDSGGSLIGQLPCAECHETHGSNNIKMVREELGNVKLADSDKFKTSGDTWTESDERQFCLKCHNNTTNIYGKTGTLNLKDQAGDPITGHQKDDNQGCSTCHGGAANSFIEAAHSPKKLTK